MTGIKTIVVMPPEIKQYFDSILLTTPAKIGDDLEKLHQIYIYIKRISEKLRKFPEVYKRWEKLEKKYLDLYERTKIKEKKQESKASNRTKEPFYYITMPNRRLERLFTGLRYRKK